MANEQVNKLSGGQAKAISANDLIAFIIKEAQHHVINDDRTKSAGLALAAHTNQSRKSKGKKKDKAQSDAMCGNCGKAGHSEPDCWSKGGGKEGQGLKQKKKGKSKEVETVVVAADNNETEMSAFTCMTDHVEMVGCN